MITATVPTIGLFPFRLGGRPRSSAAGAKPPQHSSATGTSGLADTGVNVAGLILLALVAGMVGAVTLRLGRRRRSWEF